MVQKIDGRAIAERIKDEITQEIYKLKGPRPSLAIILVGEREDSKLYVSLKEREGKKVGIDTHTYKLEEDVSQEELLRVIDFLNKDQSLDGILIQLPLPDKFETDKIIAALDPAKDVDGFHPQHPDYIISPVLGAINACLDEIKFAGKTACAFYNSSVFGAGLENLFSGRSLEILPLEKSDEADVLVTALGLPQSVKKEVIKPGAVVIDVGTTKVEEKVLGDVDFNDVMETAGYLTPVPGGIGPMTIAFLFKNVWESFKRRNGYA